MSIHQKIIGLLLALATIVIFSLSIVGIVHAQYPLAQHLFIVILVFIIFAAFLVLGLHCLSTGNDNYDVNQDRSNVISKAGQTNPGFAGGKANKGDKWVSNYVPYGDYPSGKQSPIQITVEDEQKNGSSSWKKNYVAHEEEKQDATKD